MIFKKISEIDLEESDGWGPHNIFLTFDLDWAHDDILSYAIDLVEDAAVPATWFVTPKLPF